MARRRRRGSRSSGSALLLVVLLVVAALAFVAWREGALNAPLAPAPPSGGILRMHYVDVGQGDATVWQLPGGAFVVYDCGPPARSAAENRVVAKLRELGATRLHALVASHGHLDHVGGCEEVLAEFEVSRVYDAWYTRDDRPESYRRFQREVEAEGATLHTLDTMRPGDALDLGTDGARATLLWPSSLFVGHWDDIAKASLVVRLEHGASSFCFQGDVEEGEERALAASSPGDFCDAYLVGHHGSRHASTTGWLEKMSPSIAVAGFGENSYGHPTSEALCRVQQAGATVYATNRGDVTIESDGQALRVLAGTPESKDYCALGADYWS